ncbi:serine/threonine protein kinase [Archangium gephyra]|uniref:Serine/threonine protein kinase n=1 Tax=Archangium gephyra TaxID=48 RepID=A0AAC8Q650_9BACT|nr:serine/threonine-protein kinase [Archangium gephyra]AKJ01780.1 serine/threonine protein kinase [Archangium gephyra]REG34590.1 serine/threonine protein kinase [Archangium gephyra]
MDRKSPKVPQSTATLTRGGAAVEPTLSGPIPVPPPPRQAFSEGTEVAGRYRVERFLSRGGMGEVYAAEDLSLHEPVALKTIRPELAATPEALLRFKRELRLARRVTHPNVCRVFDIGEHEVVPQEGGTPYRIVFLTMELLAGRTLHEQLVRHGRMPPEQVLRLAEQMAGALDAAHAAQIIHRDFKPGNVMLVPTPPAAGGLRAVVTDFGLARGELLEGDGSASREGHIVGSPSYMSPEQVEGLPLSPASDIYSFGLVLFEMVTGQRPFVADTPTATSLLRLRQAPPSPLEFVPELALSWEEVLLRCLERQPGKRFSTASEAMAALRSGEPTPALVKPTPARKRPPAKPSSEPSGTGSQRLARRVVAVLAPRNLMARAELSWLSTALAELLSAELAMGEQLRLLPGEGVVQMRRDLLLPEEEGFAAATLQRIRAHSGVDLVLTGAYLVQGREEAARLRLNLRLQEATTGETLAHLTEVGAEGELLELVSRVGTALRKRLGLAPLTTEQAHGVRSAMPAEPEAARLYAEGLAALRVHDAATAVERFERVVKHEPAFAPAHSALAAALQYLYQEEAAKAAARRAFELSSSLSREERLLVSARHHEAQAEWPQAIEAYRTLFEFFPDNVEYGTALVFAQVSAGQNREAQSTLEALRRLPAPLSEDARIELAAAVATSATADFIASRRHAEAAVSRSQESSQGQLAASALIMEAYAARNLGEPLRAVELLEESERLFLAGGDRGGAARSMLVHAMALIDTGRLLEAERVFVSAIEAAREIKGASLEAEALLCAGGLSCRLGHLSEGLKRASGAVELFRQRGRLSDMNSSTILKGMVRRLMGGLDEGRRLLEEGSHAAQVLFEDGYAEAWGRYELGCLLMDLGELAQSRQQLERALALRRARGLGAFVAETELALACLSLEEGRAQEALAVAESALSAYAALKSLDGEGLANAVKARALMALGKASAAREALERARTLAGGSEDVFIAAEVQLTGAALVRRDGGPSEREEAARQMQALATRAARDGMKRVALEARLLRLELQRETKAATVRKELLSLQKEANRLGYRGLLQRATALLGEK